MLGDIFKMKIYSTKTTNASYDEFIVYDSKIFIGKAKLADYLISTQKFSNAVKDKLINNICEISNEEFLKLTESGDIKIDGYMKNILLNRASKLRTLLIKIMQKFKNGK